nr:hypothetical protein [uncultured Chryseobacterium sp.]
MKSLLLSIFGLLVIQCGTDQGESIEYTYNILNASGKNVKLIPYVNGNKEVENSITLQNNQTFTKKYVYTPPGAAGFTMTGLFNKTAIGSITHVEVVFDNSKKVIYQGCTESNQCFNQPRNIFNPIYNDEQVETYTITSEDNQNAVSCNGNCY